MRRSRLGGSPIEFPVDDLINVSMDYRIDNYRLITSACAGTGRQRDLEELRILRIGHFQVLLEPGDGIGPVLDRKQLKALRSANAVLRRSLPLIMTHWVFRYHW